MVGAVFFGLTRVLLQERETSAEGVRMKGVVWITGGTSLVPCAVPHLRFFSESERRLPSITDTEAMTRRITLKRTPNPLDRGGHPDKRARADADSDSTLLCVDQHDLGNVSEHLNDDIGVFSETVDMLDIDWLAIKTKTQKSEPTSDANLVELSQKGCQQFVGHSLVFFGR